MDQRKVVWIVILMISAGLLQPIMGQAQSPTTLEVNPILTEASSYNITRSVSQNWNGLGTVASFLTGDNYYHVLKVHLEDELTQGFGIDEEYRLIINYNLQSTIFDPDSTEFIIENDQTVEIPLDFGITTNELLYFGFDLLVVRDIQTNVTIWTDIQSYYLPQSQGITLGEEEYIVQTQPTFTQYQTTGSFTWNPLDKNYFFVDPIFIPNNETVEASITIYFRYITSSDSADRLRVNIDDESRSMEIQSQTSISFRLELKSVYTIEIQALSDYLEFAIDRIDISLPFTIYQNGLDLEIPHEGWMISVLLFAISIGITIKEEDTVLEIKKEEN